MTLGRPGEMFEYSTLELVTMTMGRPVEKTVKPWVLQVSVQVFTRRLLKKVKHFLTLVKQFPGLVN